MPNLSVKREKVWFQTRASEPRQRSCNTGLSHIKMIWSQLKSSQNLHMKLEETNLADYETFFPFISKINLMWIYIYCCLRMTTAKQVRIISFGKTLTDYRLNCKLHQWQLLVSYGIHVIFFWYLNSLKLLALRLDIDLTFMSLRSHDFLCLLFG